MKHKPISSGDVFERLTVVSFYDVNKHRAKRYKCRCLCGKEKVFNGGDLNSGRAKSCGCLRSDRISETQSGSKNHFFIHGGGGTKLHRLWRGMQERCEDPKHISYVYYGKKGICVCLAWKDFNEFRKWAESKGYRDGLSIDRIDPTHGYEPENCEIVTRSENAARSNKSRKRSRV